MTRSGQLTRALPWLTGIFMMLAYARIVGVESASFTSADAEQWLFAPEDTSPGLVLAIAAWLLYRRRDALARLPDIGSTAAATPFVLLCLASFVWAHLNAAYDLLAVSLVALVCALVCARGGVRALRVVALPCVVLLLSIPIPSPLYNEIVWQLQLASATGARVLLDAIGLDFTLRGVVLTSGEQAFLVIEECSGLRSIRTLLLVSIVIRELLGLPLRALALLAGSAVPLALLLNIARVALVAGSQDAGALDEPGSHVGQGLAILAVGTVILFGVGHFLGGSRTDARATGHLTLPWRALCAGALLLAMLAWTLEPWPVPTPQAPDLRALPMQRGDWTATGHKPDRLFTGQLPLGQIETRSYTLTTRRGTDAGEVSLFLGVDSALLPRLRPYASKLERPGRDWNVDAVSSERLWSLSQDARVLQARRGDERALVYVFATGDEGLVRESLRSLLALERGPFARDVRRSVVRLSTYLGDDDVGGHGARSILDRFVGDFRDVLASL